MVAVSNGGGAERPVPATSGDAASSGAGAADSRMRALHDTHAGPLYRFLLRLTLGERHLAEDLLQEAIEDRKSVV